MTKPEYMKKYLLFAASLLLMASCSSETHLRFMSFNIEHTAGTFEKDSTTSWAARCVPVETMLMDIHPDVAFFQESQGAQLDSLEKHLADTYEVVRYDQKGGGYYYMSFIYDKSKIELLESEPRWFSPDPTVPFTSGEWDPKFTKMAVLGHFKVLETGKDFWAIGAHFFPKGDNRIKCSECMVSWIGEKAGDKLPAICCGDMNLIPDHEMLQPLYDAMSDAVDNAADSDGRDRITFQRWGRGVGKVLDHIFYRNMTPLTYRVVDDENKYGLKYLSDHNAIYSDFVF